MLFVAKKVILKEELLHQLNGIAASVATSFLSLLPLFPPEA